MNVHTVSFRRIFNHSILVVCLSGLANGGLQGITTVSQISTDSLQFSPYFPVFIRYSATTRSDLLAFDREKQRIVIAMPDSLGKYSSAIVVDSTLQTDFLYSANFNKDGIDDIISVQRDSNKIFLYSSDRKTMGYSRQSFSVPFYPEQVLVEDLNNDKYLDIIVIGRLSSGITVLLGKKNNQFQPPKVLFPEIPVSEVTITRINGDNTPDFIIHNWLTNEDLIYIGVGNLRYSLQSSLSYDNDTTSIVTSDFTHDGIMDIVVASLKNKTIQLLAGDGLGSYQVIQTLTLQTIPQKMIVSQVRQSGLYDIILDATAVGVFSIITNRSDGLLNEEIQFGCRRGNGTLLVSDINYDSYLDLVRFDRSLSFDVYWNARSGNLRGKKETHIPVGLDPSSIVLSDVNNDNIVDLSITNKGNSTISVVLNDSTGSLQSQFSFEVSEHPVQLWSYSTSDTMTTYIVQTENSSTVSILSVISSQKSEKPFDDIISYTIPLRDKPASIYPDIGVREASINFFVTYILQGNSLAYFRQVRETRFVSKNLVPVKPSRILGANIADINNDFRTDILYAYYDNNQKINLFGVNLNDEKSDYKESTSNVHLGIKKIDRAFIAPGDLNGDGFIDVVINASPKGNVIVITGNSTASFSAPYLLDSAISLTSGSDIKIIDFNFDGIMDIIVIDRASSSCFFYQGDGAGKYTKMHSENIPLNANVQFIDINNDHSIEMVYTNPGKYYITVCYDVL